jgi:transcriptional regulator with PAS, ATPase and Fis domain
MNKLPLNSFWKTIHPFHNQKIPKSLTNFDLTKFNKCQNRLGHKEMVEVVRANCQKEFIQKPIFILSNRFILEYIELAQKNDFSYAAVWQLKEQFLKLLHESIVSAHKRESILIKVTEAERQEVQEAENQFPNVEIISNDFAINFIKIKIPKYAKIKKPIIDILLTGETGTGKDLFARAFHESSGRDDDKFVTVNCGSISKDLFEGLFFGHKKGSFTGAIEKQLGYFAQADGGTIFLDEIGEVDLNHQKRFLRVLENREIQPLGGKSKKVDVKIVYATNRDLEQMVEDGKFRRDLLHRINKFSFSIPPLRKRKHDIPSLVNCFIEKYDENLKNNPELKPINVTADCMALIKKYKWKGNVRELKNVMERIIVDRNVDDIRQDIEPSDLPQHILEPVVSEKIDSKPKKGRKKKPSDEELIRLEKEGWTQDQVADKFEVRRETVNRWHACIRKKNQQDQS